MPLSQLPAAPQQHEDVDDDDDLTLGSDEFDALMSAAKRVKSAAADDDANVAAAASPTPPLPPPPPLAEEEQQPTPKSPPRRRSRRSFPAALARAAVRGGGGADLSAEVVAAAAAAEAALPPAAFVAAPLPTAPAAPAPAPAAPASSAAAEGAALAYRGAMRYARTPREAEVAALAILKALGCDDADGGAAAAAASEAEAPAAAAASPSPPTSSSSLAVGFDIEWTATFRRGQPPGRVALVQICYETKVGSSASAAAAAAAAAEAAAAAAAPASGNPLLPPAPPSSSSSAPPPAPSEPSGRGCAVVLFHVAHCGVPPSLERLLSDARVLKVGVACRTDAQKLAADWPGADAWPLADLGGEALRRGLSPCNAGAGGGGVWGLAALAREVLPGRPRLPKPQGLRTGSWDAAPLSAAQRQYAACDAFASLAVWRALERLGPPPPTASQEALEALARLGEREQGGLPQYRAAGRAAAAAAAAQEV